MQEIIKKALDEALTAKYYAELDECAETDYAFSPGFLSEMKALIRKTDNKLIYYSKYLAVAACAVVAVGCAVMLPQLLQHDVHVETTPGSSTDVSDTTPEETSSLPESGTGITTVSDTEDNQTGTVTTPPDYTDETSNSDISDRPEVETATPDGIQDENKGTGGITTSVPEETDVTDADEEDADEEDADEEDADSVDDYEDVDVEEYDCEIVEGDIVEEEDADEDVDEDIEVDDEVDEEVDVDEDADEDVDEDIEVDDEVDEEVDGDEDLGEEVLIDIEGATLGEVVENAIISNDPAASLDELEISSCSSSIWSIDCELADTSFLMEFIENNLSLPRSDTYDCSSESVTIELALSAGERPMYDYSARNNYDDIFSGGYYEYEEEVWDDYAPCVRITVYTTGTVKVDNLMGAGVYFSTDPASAAELYDRVNSGRMPETAGTVGDIIDETGLRADTIYSGYGKIGGLYDVTLVNVPVDDVAEKQFIADLLEKYRNTPVEESALYSNSYSAYDRKLTIEFAVGTTKIGIQMHSENEIIIGTRMRAYRFTVDKSEVKNIMNFICGCAGVEKPVYFSNFAEYIKGRPGSDRFIQVRASDNYVNEYTVSDEAKLAEMYDMFMKYAEQSEYKPFASTIVSNGGNNVCITWGGNWQLDMDNNEISVFTNKFTPGDDNLRDLLKNYVMANAEAADALVTETDDVPVDDVDEEVEDDIDIE